MYGTEVNLTKRIPNPDGSGTRYVPVQIAPNGKVKPDIVLIDGKPVREPRGSYCLDWRENGRRVRITVGTDATQANLRRVRQEQILAAKSNGLVVAEEDEFTGTNLVESVREYLDEIKNTKKHKTYVAYRLTLEDLFLESCHKQTLEEVERKDLISFATFLRDKKKLHPRTVYNRFAHVVGFLKHNGIRGLVNKNDWPRYVEEEPEIYERQDLDQFFAACTDEELVYYKFFLMTGMREQEVMHCTWSEVNFQRKTVMVRYKPEYGFSPKAYKGREIPIPDQLVELLKERKKKAKGALLFPTSGNLPYDHFLERCKQIAKRAGLNQDDFWLHKFRATFATWALWSGVDLRTVQMWMGHSDLESTMRYLKPNRSEEVREKVNSVFG